MKFTAFGIPVQVDLFFIIGLVMIWSWAGGNRAGLFAAVFVGIFTLVHELGHALTARRFGATATITLNLFVGWATYAAPHPLTRRQRNSISLAGPMSQIVLAVPVLAATYYALPKHGSALATSILGTGRGNVAFDVWQGAVWAGVVIGLLNLLPLWPLDGGHVVDSFLTSRFGERQGRRYMLIGTLVVVVAIAVLGFSATKLSAPYSFVEREVIRAQNAPFHALLDSFPVALWEQVRSFPGHVLDFPLLLLIFCGLNSFLSLQRLAQHDRVATWIEMQNGPRRPAGAAAPSGNGAAALQVERTGWLEGVAVASPSGWGPSPWLQAYLALRAGDAPLADQWLATVARPGRPRWVLPDPTERPELRGLVERLGNAPTVDDPERSLVLLGVLAAHGTAEQIAQYGLALYSTTHDDEALYLTAGGLARTGHGDDALAWLRRAVEDRPDAHRLATDRAFWPLHDRVDFQQLLAQARVGR